MPNSMNESQRPWLHGRDRLRMPQTGMIPLLGGSGKGKTRRTENRSVFVKKEVGRASVNFWGDATVLYCNGGGGCRIVCFYQHPENVQRSEL